MSLFDFKISAEARVLNIEMINDALDVSVFYLPILVGKLDLPANWRKDVMYCLLGRYASDHQG